MISTKLNILTCLLCVLIFAFSSCEKNELNPIETDNVAPGEITNATVENLAGAAKLTYTLPSDPDLLYAEAKYTTNNNGREMSFKSSYYTNNLLIEGFADTSEYNIELYAVDRSENKSKPYVVQIRPEEPPFLNTLRTLLVSGDFGGITIDYTNPTEADLAIGVLTPDSVGDYVTAGIHYTARDTASFSVRGYSSDPREFGIYVRDKWGNYSDTIFNTYTPLYETQLDKTKFSQYNINATDAPSDQWGGIMESLWDGRAVTDANAEPWGAHTGATAGLPPMFWTVDLGVTTRLTRFLLQAVQDDKHWFNDQTPRVYEIWGSTDPAPNGSFDGWILLATHEMIKPSGLPVGQLTEDDRAAGRAGDEVYFPLDMPAVRYIRIRCLNNWGNNTNMVISEITLWGGDEQ